MRVKIIMSKPVNVTVKANIIIDDTIAVERIEEGTIEFHTSNAMPNVQSLIGKYIDWVYVGKFGYERYKIIDAYTE